MNFRLLLTKLISVLFLMFLLSSCQSQIDIDYFSTKFGSNKNPANQVFYIENREFKRTDFVAQLDLSSASRNSDGKVDLFLPVIDELDFDFEIDWGDGVIEVYKKQDNQTDSEIFFISHQYNLENMNPIVRISGMLQGFGIKFDDFITLESEMPELINKIMTIHVSKVLNFGDLDYISFELLFALNFNLSEFAPMKDGAYANFKNVERMDYMFVNSMKLSNVDFSGLDLSSLINMSSMLSFCNNLKSVNLHDVELPKVEDMSYMLSYSENLESIDLSGLEFPSVILMNNMFSYAKKLSSANLSNAKFMNVIDMTSMFSGAEKLIHIDLSNIEIPNVEDLSFMFSYAKSLTTIDFKDLNLSKVTNVSLMFSSTENLSHVNFQRTNFSSLEDISDIFSLSKGIEHVDFSGAILSAIKDMSHMFSSFEKLDYVNLSNVDLSNVDDMSFMFYKTINLTYLDFSNTSISPSFNSLAMFIDVPTDSIVLKCPLPAELSSWQGFSCSY